MSTNGENPVEDTEMAERDGEQIVTMMDVLKEQQDFEDDANAVLGASDEKECTYSQGYIKRQAIYACVTCCPDAKDNPLKRAGFCLACSLTCHENHDVMELYTKRNFRCDCGNPKFANSCHFTPSKPDLNEDNIYNQNFVGLYCSCKRPYGDLDSSLDDDMIQCIICEDWWHASHLDTVVPPNDQYSEMVCKLCMEKNEFLHDYSNLAVNVENGDVDVKVSCEQHSTSGNDEKLTSGDITNKYTNRVESEDLSAEDKSGLDSAAPPVEAVPASDTKNVENSSAEKAITDELMENSEGNEITPKDPSVETNGTETTTEPGKTEKENVEFVKPVENVEADINKFSDASVETDVIEKAVEVGTEEVKPDTTITAFETEQESRLSEEQDKSHLSEDKENVVAAKSTEDIGKTADSESNVTQSILEKSTDKYETTENSKKGETAEAKQEQQSQETDYSNEATHIPQADNKANAEVTSHDIETNDTGKYAANENVSYNSADDKEGDDTIKNKTEPSVVNTVSEVTSLEENKVSELTNSAEITVSKVVSAENKRKLSTEDVIDDGTVKKPKLDSANICIRPKGVAKMYKGATFWSCNFRRHLCTCNQCITMYKDLSVLFLTDLEDTVFAYEKLGQERTAGKPNQYEKGMEALSSLGRVQQIDALTEYNKMRDKLLTFLQNFKDRKEIVTEQDIKSFFAGMKPKKLTDGVYFCG